MGAILRNSLSFLALACASASHAAPLHLPPAVTDADYAPVNIDEARLGQLLFFDPILAGNRNISCASCHHPRFATSDGLSLGLGEGAVGLGPKRHVVADNPPEQRIPRNSPALFNLGAHEFTRMFHDGRIEADPSRPTGLRTPMEDEMVAGFVSILSAQTMFPVLSPDEMAGHYGENEVSKAVRSGLITGPGGAWDLISQRVSALPEYQEKFGSVYAEIGQGRSIGFTDISNAIAAFIAFEWRSDQSHFDAVLRGDAVLDGEALRGAEIFYEEANCVACHSGPFLTDHGFHAMGAPQIGPGKAERFESHSRDDGRFRVTGKEEDRYAFRTPSLRNVTRTGPWGHAGGASDLHAFLAQHSGSKDLPDMGGIEPVLPPIGSTKPDFVILEDPEASAAIQSARSYRHPLSATDIDALIAFLTTLEDPVALSGRLGIPESVPSGLPVDR